MGETVKAFLSDWQALTDDERAAFLAEIVPPGPIAAVNMLATQQKVSDQLDSAWRAVLNWRSQQQVVAKAGDTSKVLGTVKDAAAVFTKALGL